MHSPTIDFSECIQMPGLVIIEVCLISAVYLNNNIPIHSTDGSKETCVHFDYLETEETVPISFDSGYRYNTGRSSFWADML